MLKYICINIKYIYIYIYLCFVCNICIYIEREKERICFPKFRLQLRLWYVLNLLCLNKYYCWDSEHGHVDLAAEWLQLFSELSVWLVSGHYPHKRLNLLLCCFQDSLLCAGCGLWPMCLNAIQSICVIPKITTGIYSIFAARMQTVQYINQAFLDFCIPCNRCDQLFLLFWGSLVLDSGRKRFRCRGVATFFGI